jgi:hypothetical protein
LAAKEPTKVVFRTLLDVLDTPLPSTGIMRIFPEDWHTGKPVFLYLLSGIQRNQRLLIGLTGRGRKGAEETGRY